MPAKKTKPDTKPRGAVIRDGEIFLTLAQWATISDVQAYVVRDWIQREHDPLPCYKAKPTNGGPRARMQTCIDLKAGLAWNKRYVWKTDKTQIEEHKDRALRIKADMAELELEKARGRVIEKDFATLVVGEWISGCVQRLLQIKDVAATLEGKPVLEIRRLLSARVHDAIDELRTDPERIGSELAGTDPSETVEETTGFNA